MSGLQEREILNELYDVQCRPHSALLFSGLSNFSKSGTWHEATHLPLALDIIDVASAPVPSLHLNLTLTSYVLDWKVGLANC